MSREDQITPYDPQAVETRWQARWAEWEDVRLAELEVTVLWIRHEQQRSVSLTTLAYVGGGQ